MEQAEAPRLDTLKEDQDDQIEQFELDLEPIETPRTTNNGPKKETYYVVEFKGNRNDLFYPAPDCAPVIKMGEHVIVEGDRGKDLGIIIRTDITIDEYKNQFSQITAGPDGSQAIKEIEPKKIYRIALPHETASLVSKLQDEEKALMLVRAKAIQHEIYMQIVDAEYQWDRRKLTFYFIADRRIDFRDLVRELFKIYKTRIWMCAVSH
ncbi:PSP1-domain-containing protein [Neoconidiobolus thromboides FSU 785]|nr:PSP1-domain-containing protein [Neoconidiobolus thromboides FSU 785]